jgi:hypothetical protein
MSHCYILAVLVLFVEIALVVRQGSPLTGSGIKTVWNAVTAGGYSRTGLAEVPLYLMVGASAGTVQYSV